MKLESPGPPFTLQAAHHYHPTIHNAVGSFNVITLYDSAIPFDLRFRAGTLLRPEHSKFDGISNCMFRTDEHK